MSDAFGQFERALSYPVDSRGDCKLLFVPIVEMAATIRLYNRLFEHDAARFLKTGDQVPELYLYILSIHIGSWQQTRGGIQMCCIEIEI